MLRNYLKTAIRSFSKRKSYFILNILGLVTGMTCCLFICHYVSYERSYDTFQSQSSQIVRLRLDVYQAGKRQFQSVAVYPAIAPTIKKDYPEVADFCRLHLANLVFSGDEKDVRFNEPKGFYADPSFLKMFDVQPVNENASNMLSEPFQIMLSESMAAKYFGKEEAVGKKLTVKNPAYLQTYLVTGVFKDYPKNSHLSFDYLVAYSTYGQMLQHYGYPAGFTENNWEFRDFYAYLQLKPDADWKQLQAKLPAFCDLHINNRPENRNNNNRNELYLLPVKDIHLHSSYFYEAGVNGNGQAVSFLLLVALFIICIAWINYINLATARSVERAKEVGVRKVMGAIRANLIKQFLAEGFFLNSIALLFSFLIFWFFSGSFDIFTGKETATDQLLSPVYWQVFAGIFLAGAFISAIYPAFVLSAFNPITVLKGIFKNSAQGIALRKGLITLQFVISIALIAATIIVYQQMWYMNKQQLGVNINQTVVLQGSTSLSDTAYQNIFQTFKDELLRRPDIKSVTASTSVPGKEIQWSRNVQRLDISNAVSVPVKHLGVDVDFIPDYGIEIIAGRNFSRQFGTDDKAVLLNDKALKLLGFRNAEEAINKKIKRSADTVTIAGIVADFHQVGLQKEIEPMVFLLMPNTRNFYSLKISSSDVQQTMNAIEAEWKNYFRDDPFNAFFLDETFNNQYKADNLFASVFNLFAFLAIVLSCSGLLGLSAYTISQRAKEVSIRKVMGAGAANISVLLTKDFIRLITIAFIVASPIAWYVMDQWLQDFAYRITIHWWVFALAGLVAAFIALSAIAFQVVKAALANPISSLRAE